MPSLPLSNVRVLDLTRVLAGPFAAQMLGDLGAQVIKIERPIAGDDARTYGGPYLTDAEGKSSRDNSFYLSANRNKRSVTINMAKPRGQELIRELARKADVVMENFKVGDLARYGLDYASIKAINPRVVYCSITGFGQHGPYAKRPGYDAVFQAMGGLMSVTGHPDGQPGGGPMKVGPSIVDVLTGLNASIAIIGALYGRDANGGQGQHIDLALLDAVIASLSHYAQIYLVSGDMPPRRGTSGNGGVPSQTFHCADGDVMVTAGNDGQFARLCEVVGRPELARDPRFATNNARVAHRDIILPLLEDLFREKPLAHWLPALEAAGVPSGPINNLAQVFGDPQVIARGMSATVAHPLRDALRLIANPIHYSETPITGYRPPPMLGEHTEEVLSAELGLDKATLAALRAEGVI
jgi:crotonobetainyl-CoA:carnitine CoA-transferase CaiB-like acyl-CoA transferase